MENQEHSRKGRRFRRGARFLGGHGWIMGLAALVALSGCAPTQIKTISKYAGSVPKPNTVLVYNFAVSPDEVQLDRGISARIQELIKKTPRTKEEKAVGHAVAEALATHLVKELNAIGVPATKAYGMPSTMGNAIEIEGQFLSIDEGNRTERVVIGLGAGRTDVKTLTQVYDARFGSRMLVEEFDTDAKSGYKPGMAEMMAVGVLTHHLLVSTLASGALAAGSEAFMAGVDADARRTAQEIVKQLGQFFVAQGWIPASNLETWRTTFE
jgi:Domain of unknown function (DUF4410)